MGVYEPVSEHSFWRGDNVVGPRFMRTVCKDQINYLFRSTDDGTWMVTSEKADIAKNRGVLKSSRASDLPYEEGLGWKWLDGEGVWQNDPDLKCTEVQSQQRHHRAWRGEREEGRRERKCGREREREEDDTPADASPSSPPPPPPLAGRRSCGDVGGSIQ